jgi:hypothetical protein
MTGVGFLNGVHRQAADGVNAFFFDGHLFHKQAFMK